MTQGISHTSKPLTYYVSSPSVMQLVARIGDFLEGITPVQKGLIIVALADHLTSGSEHYTIIESLNTADPDALLDDILNGFIVAFVSEVDDTTIALFLHGLTSLLYDDLRNAE